MPQEVAVIAVVSIIAGTLMILGIVKTVATLISNRHQTGGGASLTTSELDGLIRDAVVAATQPLAARVEALEQRLDHQPERLAPRPDLLEGMADYEAPVTASRASEPSPVR